MSNGKSHEYCRKEKEIAEVHADVQTIKRIVMGNGQEGLVVTVPKLAQSVDTLNKNLEDNNTLTSAVIRYKDEMEGYHEGKNVQKKRSRWIVNVTVTVLGILIGALVTLLIAT